MTTFKLWDRFPPFKLDYEPVIEFYPAENKKTDATVVIFPGGGYYVRAPHEGKDYAEFLNSIGMNAFVCEYRVAPSHFPAILLDARRAVRFVRANSEKFGINPDKVAVMGSSAGGHLAALVSTYTDEVNGEGLDEVDNNPYLPNATILCYPVIHHPVDNDIGHWDSFYNFIGDRDKMEKFSPDLLVTENTPTAFIWHTSEDNGVSVINSYKYAEALKLHSVPHELHVFPYGGHGYGLGRGDSHISQWSTLLKNWFVVLGWLND